MINPTDHDLEKARRVVLRKNEDRGVLVGLNYSNQVDFSQLLTGQVAKTGWVVIRYDSDGENYKSLESDLTWEDEYVD